MYYLYSCLFFISLRLGCRIIAGTELILYGSITYYLHWKYGFEHMLESMVIISSAACCVMAAALFVATMDQSSAIMFCYLIFTAVTTMFLLVYICICFNDDEITFFAFMVLFVGISAMKLYIMLVVLSYHHFVVEYHAEDGF